MRRHTAVAALVLMSMLPGARAQKCERIRGRAVMYIGDGQLVIWHVGTHHTFAPADKASFDLVCSYLDCTSRDKQPALYGDFTVCPTEAFKAGAMQKVKVKSVRNRRVVAAFTRSPER